jgi:ABC-type multidrug transport system ATPase subunit
MIDCMANCALMYSKTTILSCIVGLRKLDEGDILVCGARPGTRESGIPGRRIGYMPQV